MRCGPDMRALGRNVGKIGAGNDRLHPGQCPRLFGIDRYDPGMGMRAALDAAPQHTRHCHIGAEIGPARNLVDAVGANWPTADYPKRGLVEIVHLDPPSTRPKPDMASRTVAARAYQKTLSAANGLLPHRGLFIHLSRFKG